MSVPYDAVVGQSMRGAKAQIFATKSYSQVTPSEFQVGSLLEQEEERPW